MLRVGLVLGGGGLVGQGFHAGVLAGIQDVTGWDPRRAEVVVGTSAGAYLAVLLRAGISATDLGAASVGNETTPEAAALLAPILASRGIPALTPRLEGRRQLGSPTLLARFCRRPWEMRVGTVSAAILPAGRRSLEHIAPSLDHLFGAAWPGQALWICALRLSDGRRVVFGRPGEPKPRPAAAVVASCSVPGFFEPTVIDGVTYVDGGALSATNLDVLAGHGLDLVLVSAPMSSIGFPARPRALLGSRLIHRTEVRAEAARVRRRGSAVVLFEPGPVEREAMGPRTLDGTRRPAVTALAREMAWRRLEQDVSTLTLLRNAASAPAETSAR
ncbi:MAG: patatin-like phospholipase family protein [Acidimicrobiia bacterium]